MLVAMLGSENHPGMIYRVRVIIGSAIGGGRLRVRYVRGVVWAYGQRIRIRCIFLINFHV